MDTSSAPLADYFWIAGIVGFPSSHRYTILLIDTQDSLSYNDPVFRPPNTSNGVGPPSPQVDATIEEGDSEGESPNSPQNKENGVPRATARHSRNNSWNRLSKLSNDARNSISTLDELETTHSNRSSITIKAVPLNGNASEVDAGSGGMGDFEFNRAMEKFTSERENFLDDLSFSAGAPVQARPPMTINPRAEKLKAEDGEMGGSPGRKSPLRSVGGSIRRRISFRDMNSMKRQPSSVQRSCKLDSWFHIDEGERFYVVLGSKYFLLGELVDPINMC